jgi:hypothetical protein
MPDRERIALVLQAEALSQRIKAARPGPVYSQAAK